MSSFYIDKSEKFDLYSNKNSKYLLYKFSNWIQSLPGAKKLIIRHTAEAKDSYGLKKIEEKDWQFLIEKIIHGIEFENAYEISVEKKKYIDKVEKYYKLSRRFYQSLFLDIADSFIEYIHSLDVMKYNNWTMTLKQMGGEWNLCLKLKMPKNF